MKKIILISSIVLSVIATGCGRNCKKIKDSVVTPLASVSKVADYWLAVNLSNNPYMPDNQTLCSMYGNSLIVSILGVSNQLKYHAEHTFKKSNPCFQYGCSAATFPYGIENYNGIVKLHNEVDRLNTMLIKICIKPSDKEFVINTLKDVKTQMILIDQIGKPLYQNSCGSL